MMTLFPAVSMWEKAADLGMKSAIMLSETLSSTECSMYLWRIGSSLSFKGGTESNSKYISLSFSHSRRYKAYQNWLKFWDVDFERATMMVKSSLKEKSFCRQRMHLLDKLKLLKSTFNNLFLLLSSLFSISLHPLNKLAPYLPFTWEENTDIAVI